MIGQAPVDSLAALTQIWTQAGLPPAALEAVLLPGDEPVFPSSFAVATAAQVGIGAAALAAIEIGRLRHGAGQTVQVRRDDAAAECTGLFSLDGRIPPSWDKLSGVYACGSRGDRQWVRVHANFAHHRDGVLRLLGLPPGDQVPREAVAAALRDWEAQSFEEAAARADLVVAAVRTPEQWAEHPQSQAVAQIPLVSIERIGDAPPMRWPASTPQQPPLDGLRVLDFTRILAGPVCGRTLAAYGAEVMLVNSPALPNIEAIADTSRGKLSAHLDLSEAAGRQVLRELLAQAQVMVQGYRPGGLEAKGFGPAQAAAIRPGIVYVSLSAYGHQGPWAQRRGFDSLVQSTTGLNLAEAQAFGELEPRTLPMPILDYASGFLMAFGAQVALMRQAREGGSWHVRVALARTGLWLQSLGRMPASALAIKRPELMSRLQDYPSGFGRLAAMAHAARFSLTPARWARPSMPPGSHPPRWPEFG